MNQAGIGRHVDRLGRESPGRLRSVLRAALLGVAPASWLRATVPIDQGPLWTFDDGPDPEHTPRVLDVLAQLELKASFFLVGERAARHPGLVRRIHSAGHAIGNHSHTHPAPGTMGRTAYLHDVRQARHTLEDMLGQSVKDFRPPHGHLTPGSLAGLWADHHRVVLWSVDPKDYAAPNAQDIAHRLRLAEVRPSDIILLHDTRPWTASAITLYHGARPVSS